MNFMDVTVRFVLGYLFNTFLRWFMYGITKEDK
jgi:hypothetical protein